MRRCHPDTLYRLQNDVKEIGLWRSFDESTGEGTVTARRQHNRGSQDDTSRYKGLLRCLLSRLPCQCPFVAETLAHGTRKGAGEPQRDLFSVSHADDPASGHSALPAGVRYAHQERLRHFSPADKWSAVTDANVEDGPEAS